jgi:hypothetical protein
MGFAAGLLFVGGLVGVLFIRNEPHRVREAQAADPEPIHAEDCAGGQLVGAPREVGRDRRAA